MSATWWKEPSDLVPEQVEILGLPPSEGFLIKGPPGSGKTNLLLLRANYLSLGSHPNLCIVVYGSVLRKFIQSGGADYNFPPTKIVTHSSLFRQILRENDAYVDTAGMKIMEARRVIAEAVDELFNSGVIGVQYDALLLDEAQDYLPREIEVFRKLSSVLVATADSRQKIYEGDDPMPLLCNYLSATFELKYHYRNGRKICCLADGVMAGKPDHISLLAHSSYDESEYPSSVIVRNGVPLRKQVELMMRQIEDQRVAYPNDSIGVLCVKKDDLEIVKECLATSSLWSLVTDCYSSDFDPVRPIWLSTISSAKGLEFRAVHLVGFDEISVMRSAQKRLAFTAITRAKTALTVYHDKGLPGYLESAIRSILPVRDEITLDMTFGRG